MTDYTLRIIIEGQDRATPAIKGVSSALGDIGKIAAGVSLGNLFSGAVQSLTGMAGAALQSYASYERLGQSIGAMAAKEALLTGAASNMAQALSMTKEQSKETLDWISKLAIQSPFKQSDVAQAFRLAQALGFNTQEAKRLTAATLDWATATGAQGYDIERVNRALGQMQVKGKVSQEEINQLTEAGVDAQRILSGAFGKSGTDLQKAFQNGSITSREAIDAIIKDMERLYQGAGANSASSFAGLLSTLEEIQDIAGRNLFGGIFEAAQPYIAETVGVLSSPEFQAGLTGLGQKLGSGLTENLDKIAAGAKTVSDAIKPLLDADAPPWMVALQGLAAATGTDFKVTITPEITSLKLPSSDPNNPNGGWAVDVTAHATKITADDGSYLKVDTQARSLTLLPGVGLPPIEIKVAKLSAAEEQRYADLGAAWQRGMNSNLVFGPGASFGAELGKQHRQELGRAWNVTVKMIADWGDTWTTPRSTNANVSGSWGDFWNEVHSVIATIIPDLSQFPQWLQNAMGGLGLNNNAGMANTQGGISIGGGGISVGVNPTTGRMRATGGQASRGNPAISLTQADWAKLYTGYDAQRRATGDGFFYGGWAMVGEQGPELLNLPRGTRIYNNSDTKRMMPGFAEGTTSGGAGAWGQFLRDMARAVGLYQVKTAGPPTKEEAGFWRDFTDHSKQAAAKAGDAFVEAADDAKKAWEGAFESALGQVPGLFGTSDVTDADMKAAKYGYYTEKADEWLRQLSDEVLNGVDREGVDIKDAAKRAGIDPNLPNEIILDLVKQAWADQSFFANKGNLDLINTDAVKASLEQQQKEAQGKANIMSMFGLTDESSQQTADQLGAALNTVFGQAAQSDAMNAGSTALFNKLLGGFTDPATATAGVGAMGMAIAAAGGAPENVAILEDAGKADFRRYWGGWVTEAGLTPPVPPGGPIGPPTNPNGTTPPKNALGTPSWRGGWTVAGEYGPELLKLPGGTAIYDAPTTARMRSAPQPMVVNQTFVVNDELMAERAAQRAVELIRRRGH